MLEHPINNKGCSRIKFLLNEFYQEYKNVLLSFWGQKVLKSFIKFFGGKKVPFPKI